MTIRSAGERDLPEIMVVLDAAKGIMRSSGNMDQWINGYPSEEVILEDIKAGNAYIVEDGRRIIAYFAFIHSPEPTYAEIYDGSWPDDSGDYYVIHRIGSLPEFHGVFREVMDWAFRQCRVIRIDTHRDNAVMRHCLEKYGFSYCGIIYLANGDERLAYQKEYTAV